VPSPGTAGGRVRIYYEGDASDFERANRQVESSLARLGVIGAQTSTKGQLFNNVIDQQRRNLSALATGAKYAAGGLGILAGAGMAKVVRDGIQFNATMESNQLALKNLLGGSKEAKKFLEQLYDTAKRTPFEFTDLTSASRRLISFGLDAEKTQRILAATGDAVAAMGGGAENIDRVTLALGQMQAKGKVSAEELLQLTEAGIPAYAILKKELGLTSDQVANIGNEGIKAEDAIDALTRGMEERFGGAAKKQAKTWEGMTSTMQDTWAQMTGAITEDLFDEMKHWAPTVLHTMNQMTRIFERKDLSLGEKLEKALDVGEHNFAPLWKEITDDLDKAEIGNKFIDAVEWAIPRVAENAGQFGLKFAEGFAKGFVHADVLGKLFLTATFIRYVGGWSAFATLGKAIGKHLWPSVFSQMPSTVPTGPGAPSPTPAPSPGGSTKPFLVPIGGAALALSAGAYRKEIIDAIFPDGWANKAFHNAFDSSSITTSGGTGGFFGDDAIEQVTKTWDAMFGDDTIKPARKNLAQLGIGILDVSSATGQMAHGLRITKSDLRGASQAARFFSGQLLDGVDDVKAWERAVRRSSDDVGDALKKAGRVAGDVTDDVGDDLDGSGRDHDRFSDKARRDLDRLGDQYRRTGDIVGDFATGAGRDLDHFGNKSQQMAKQVGRNIIGVADVVTHGLGIIGDNTNEALSAFGVKKVSLSLEKAGKAAAGFQGGGSVFDVPGTGSGDSFPMLVPPDSFVLNREAAAAFFPRQVGGMVPIVTEPGERVFSPEAAAQMGGWLEWANSAVRRFQGGGNVGAMGAMLGLVNRYERKSFPYLWGGGHQGFVNAGAPVDCSGFVSDVLHTGGLLQGAPMVSGALANWGQPAKGNEPLVVYANAGHTLMRLNGRFAGTSASNPGGGAGWLGDQSASYLSGFAKRTMNVAGGRANVPRVLVRGPRGPMRGIAQGALDEAWKAARRFVASKMPAGSLGGGDIDVGGLPKALQRYNHRYPGAMFPSAAWNALFQMPFSHVAALAEWAGNGKVPGITMAQVSEGEGNLRPGSRSSDNGWGLWGITSPFADSYGVDEFGGYPGMLNPVSNAIVMSRMYPAGWSGGSPWYGTGHVTGYNQHYRGKLLRQRGGRALQRGGFAGGGRAGGGKHPPGYNPPPIVAGPPRPMSLQARLTKLGILLSNAEQTDTIADDQRILEQIGEIYAKQLRRAQSELEDLSLDKGDLRQARAAADRDIRELEKKLERGGMTPAEYRRLDAARRRAFKAEQSEILAGKESKAYEKIADLTDALHSNSDQVKSLEEGSTADLVEAVKSLKDSIDEQNSLIGRESGVQRSELVRAIADLLSGEIGGRTSMAGMNAGNGSVVTA